MSIEFENTGNAGRSRLVKVDEELADGRIRTRHYDLDGSEAEVTERAPTSEELAVRQLGAAREAAASELAVLLTRPMTGRDVLRFLVSIGKLSPEEEAEMLARGAPGGGR